MEENTPTPTTADLMKAPRPPQMPVRFWRMVDFGLMTRDQAAAAWAKEVVAGAVFDPLG